jgi:hypothetical protein
MQRASDLQFLPADWAAGGATGAGGGVYGGRSKGMHVSFLGPRPSFFHIDQCVSPASTCTWVEISHGTAVETSVMPTRGASPASLLLKKADAGVLFSIVSQNHVNL